MKTKYIALASLFVLLQAGITSVLASSAERGTAEVSVISIANPNDYVGTYVMNNPDIPFDKVVLTEKNGAIYYQAGSYEGTLTPVAGQADKFDANGGATVEFIRVEGKVTKIKITVDYSSFEGIKQATGAPAMDQYVGRYKFEGLPFEYMTMTVKDGSLYFEGGEYAGPLSMEAGKADTFTAGGQATMTFKRGADNSVQTLVVEAMGMTFEGKKQP
jgi:hypothetical protein